MTSRRRGGRSDRDHTVAGAVALCGWKEGSLSLSSSSFPAVAGPSVKSAHPALRRRSVGRSAGQFDRLARSRRVRRSSLKADASPPREHSFARESFHRTTTGPRHIATAWVFSAFFGDSKSQAARCVVVAVSSARSRDSISLGVRRGNEFSIARGSRAASSSRSASTGSFRARRRARCDPARRAKRYRPASAAISSSSTANPRRAARAE